MKQARVPLWFLAFFILWLAACGGDSPPSPGPVATAATPPLAARALGAPAARPTLPPTWTPTDSATPVTPTQTPTVTATPTITPTLDKHQRCAALKPFSFPRDGARLNFTDHHSLTFTWEYPVVGGSSILQVFRAGSDLGRALTIPGPQVVVVALPFSVLYGPGVYRWTLAPAGDDGLPIPDCTTEGRFTILMRPRTENRWPLPLDLEEE